LIVGISLAHAVPLACLRPTAFCGGGTGAGRVVVGLSHRPTFFMPPARVCVAGTGTRVYAHACFLNFFLYTRKER